MDLMQNNIVRSLCAALVLLAGSTLYAGTIPAVLDQENLGTTNAGGAVANDQTQAQTLTVGITGVLSHVNVNIFKRNNTVADITLSVRSTSGGEPDALLAAVSLPASAIGTVDTLATFDVSAANLNFNAGDLIAIELSSPANNVFPFDERYDWRRYNTDPYAGGQRFTNGVAYSDYDFAFQTFVIPAPLTGDLDGDGFVGINDLNIVLSLWNFNVVPGDPSLGDPSGDGFVGIDDLNTVLGNWNAGTPPPPGVSIPEPATAALAVLSGGVLLARKRPLNAS